MVLLEDEKASVLGLTRITREQALKQAEDIIDAWAKKSPWDVWALKYGEILPSFLASLPAFFMSQKIRNMHKLHNVKAGRILGTAPSMALSALFSAVVLSKVKHDILLEPPQCPTCVEIRAVSGQMLAGIAFPAIMAIIGNHYVLQYSYISVPPTFKDAVPWVLKILRRSSNVLLFSACLQTAVVSYTVYTEQYQWAQIREILLKSVELSKKSHNVNA